jgi:hypothetical protein
MPLQYRHGLNQAPQQTIHSNGRALCERLAMLRSRYDDGAVSPPVYAVIRAIETEIVWLEHRRVQP